ncbi:alpha/beta fold hydrolase [Nonomuraea typhae]|uniref:alpha/beta fold hydrolase n=1 Tax=Nonomuraea typhae TaxID=2603600 RepID=UPI0012FBACE9|nr:alpha/beta fold hydrolase [Nonomuraea typhae]
MERRLIVVSACAFIVAAVLYSAWVPGQFANPAVDRTEGYLSELAARDQSWSALFRAADALAGLACVLGVALAPRVRAEWPGWLAMAAFGLLTAADSAVPLDCALISSPACERAPHTLAHHLHTYTSALASAASLVAMLLLARAWRTRTARFLAGAYTLATVLTLVAAAAGHLVGVAQRAQVAVIALWLVYVAARLLAAPQDEPGHARPHVVEDGRGPAVLVAAGMGGAWFHWDAVAAGLAPAHRVIRFDRPGLGRSPAAPEPPTLYGEAARLAALAPSHPEKVAVIAHSVAAWHAEAFARLHPLRVSRVVLVDPSCRERPGRGTSGPGRALGRWLPAFGGTWAAAALARCVGPLAHRLAGGGGDPAGVYREGRVLAAAAGEWLAFRDMAADLEEIRREHPYPPVPTLVITAGRTDGCQERLARSLGADHVRLPKAGHQVQLDAPEAITRPFNGE